MDWFKIRKGVYQGWLFSLWLNAEYIMWISREDESQGGIKIARRNINNLRYANDITLTAVSEKELKNLLSRLKEESEKAGVTLNIQRSNTKFMASGPIISWQADGETNNDRLYFLGLQNHCRQTVAVKLTDTCSLVERLWQT